MFFPIDMYGCINNVFDMTLRVCILRSFELHLKQLFTVIIRFSIGLHLISLCNENYIQILKDFAKITLVILFHKFILNSSCLYLICSTTTDTVTTYNTLGFVSILLLCHTNMILQLGSMRIYIVICRLLLTDLPTLVLLFSYIPTVCRFLVISYLNNCFYFVGKVLFMYHDNHYRLIVVERFLQVMKYIVKRIYRFLKLMDKSIR